MQSRKIVLIGKTGDGKSSAGNTILSNEVFTPKASANSVTAETESRHGSVHGREITVIDTPGFFDTDRDDEEIKYEIINSLIECAPAVHAFLIVLKVGRYTRQENEVVQKFLNTMKEKHVLKHTVILFTHGDQLEGQTIEEFVKPNPQLQELVDKCGGRCHVIDNRYWNDCDSGYKSNRVQVKNLLETIDTMEKENGCFSTELLKKLEEEMQEEIKKNKKNLPPGEKLKIAKEIVYKRLQVVGAATGVLIGALLGACVAVAAVLAALSTGLKAEVVKAIVVKTAAAGGAAAVEAVAAGGGGAAGVAAAGAVVGVKAFATYVVRAAALAGAVGGVTGWKAAEEADSVYDAMIKAAKLNYKNATVVDEKIHGFVFNKFKFKYIQ